MLRLAHSYRHPLFSEGCNGRSKHEKGDAKKSIPEAAGRFPPQTLPDTRYLSAKSAPGVPFTAYVFNIRPYRSYSYTTPLPVPDFASPM